MRLFRLLLPAAFAVTLSAAAAAQTPPAPGGELAQMRAAERLLSSSDPAEARQAFESLQRGYASRDPAVHAAAATGLAGAYLIGMGVARDATRGFALLREAERLTPDNAQVQFLIGRALESGSGVAEDDRAALAAFRRAAPEIPRAGWHAGMLILARVDPAATPADAYRLIRAAAERGDESGQISTAVMLATGQGVAEDDAEARRWYLRAAQAGSAHALRGFGGMLIVGEGGPQDALRGLAYVRLARDAGDENAARMLAAIAAAPLTPQDEARITAFQVEWRANHGMPR